MRRSSPLVQVAAASLVLLLMAVLAPIVGSPPSSADRCPAGYKLYDEEEAEREARGGAEGEREEGEGEEKGHGKDGPVCVALKHPESFGELSRLNGEVQAAMTAPFASIAPGAYGNAIAQRNAMVAKPSPVPGRDGEWSPLAKTPLLADVPGYNEVNGAGLAELSGRIQDFVHVPGTSRLYAGVANGGVWRSEDLGATWKSVGDSLPTQVVGSVGWTPAGAPGGTLLVVTGDGSFGRYAVSGLGFYRSVDDGRTWQRSDGVPDGALGFKVAVDPTNPSIVYAGTSFGLFRSVDAGRSFSDVRLPTGHCAGRPTDKGCFFANVVTDVVVQAPDRFGHKGGRVLAAVGWREGDRKNDDGTVQSPRNGIYRSDTGAVGSFTRLVGGAPNHDAPAGFASRHRLGRIELGLAEGPAQNHDYVYAVVQDAVKFNQGVPVLDVPEQFPKSPVPISDVLNGIYVSRDFGTTWIRMASAEELKSPVSGSALVGLLGATYGPGIQAWFNLFVRPDPTRQTADGIPTRLVFGLEEVWQNQVTSLPLDGPTVFKVIGRYFGGTTCLGLKIRFPICPTNTGQLAPSTTTHPDQHGALYVPDGKGGVTLIVGNDGGVYRQTVGAGQELDNTRWGRGSNLGMDTLMPYHAVMAKDGTVWAGLQDNGQMKIEPDGRQIMTFGGDGFFSAVDPGNSAIAYEEFTEGSMNVTKDGGRTWRNINPALTNAGFSTPFRMDPRNPKHLMIGGREIKQTLSGPDTGAATPESTDRNKWVTVYDLGTRTTPGKAEARAAPDAGNPDNRLSALDLDGEAAYVGFCGFCDPLAEGVPFGRGLATNVGGDKPPKALKGDGWHIAAARGLPRRHITSIAIDPDDHRTVYVTLGGYERRWAPPGVVGDDVAEVGRGHVFRSTDAGETFADVSGNLPDIPVNWVELRRGQLLVGTDIGAFLSSDTGGSTYAPLGKGLPTVQVRTLELAPHDPNLVVAATFGRGVWVYRFPTPPPPPFEARKRGFRAR